MKIGILTALCDFSAAYSLITVIKSQAEMLERNGYEFDLLCCKSFVPPEEEKDIEFYSLLSDHALLCLDEGGHLYDYQIDEDPLHDFQECVKSLEDTYRENLQGYDVIITHDLMLLSWYLPHNQAIKNLIMEWPDKRWIHWFHSGASAPSPRIKYPSTLRYEAAPNSKYVFLDNYQKQDFANSMDLDASEVSVVYNARDIRDLYDFDQHSLNLIEKYKLLDHDIMQTFPVSTPRWRDKGIRQVMRIFGYWKKAGLRVKLLLLNSHSNEAGEHVQAMKDYADVAGLDYMKDVIFSSEEARYDHKVRDWSYSIPWRNVRDFITISNMFVFPSVSESCSLVQGEASVMGKFVVINSDFLPMFEFCPRNIPHFKFTQNDPDANPKYYECAAREILQGFNNDVSIANSTLGKTKLYNRDYIWQHQFEPLLNWAES